jgi:ABC-type nickel/cobalt efflux system permease component RcnA
MLTIAVAIIIIVAIYMFFHKIVYKRMMQKKLGRKVDDRELTSLTSWMNAPDAPNSENREGNGKAHQ